MKEDSVREGFQHRLSSLVASPGVRSSGVAAKSYQQRSGSATTAAVRAIRLDIFDSICLGLQAPVSGIGEAARIQDAYYSFLSTMIDHNLDEIHACTMDSDAYEAESDEAKRRDVQTNFNLAFQTSCAFPASGMAPITAALCSETSRNERRTLFQQPSPRLHQHRPGNRLFYREM
jgi:hypothetical protein